MKRVLMAACLVAGLLASAGPVWAKDYTWVADHCNTNSQSDISSWKRSDARAYGAVAVSEGYQRAGGCWNDNDVDDTPPVSYHDTGSEGPDCSGLVFKSWFLVNDLGASGGTWWGRMRNIHGPYASTDFHDGVTNGPFFVLSGKSRGTTLYMDAFAKDGHIGLIYDDTGTSSNTDLILEAKGNFFGTGIWEEDYRGDTAYVAVRRKGWTPDCAPQCAAWSRPPVVVMG
ncbi:MAG TPA: hypothetical protein VGB19_10915 [Actinomycetota bacterium]